MTFFEMTEKRESCRSYDGAKAVTKEQLMKCVGAARLAPSACNSQPWSFAAVNGGEIGKKIAKATQTKGLNKFTCDCPAFIVVFEEEATLIGGVKSQKYAEMDIGIAVAHLCYAALEQGLSTCIMGSFDENEVLSALGMENKKIKLILAVGYAKTDSLRVKKRKALEEIVTYFE